MRINVYGHNYGYVTDEVSAVPVNQANLNEENRIKFVTDLAAVSRGKHESNNPAKRYEQLLKEAAPNDTKYRLRCPACQSTKIITHYPNVVACTECRNNVLEEHPEYSEWVIVHEGTPSRPLEFLPVLLEGQVMTGTPFRVGICTKSGNRLTMHAEDFMNNITKFGYIVFNEEPHEQHAFRVYTNMRACINAGIAYSDVPYNTPEELASFKAVRVKAPMFVFNHLVTHTALSKEARSERVTALSGTDYWLPDDFRERVYAYMHTVSEEESTAVTKNHFKLATSLLSEVTYDGMVECLISNHRLKTNSAPFIPADISQDSVQQFFKTLGYPQEIYQRAMLEFRYKEFILTGWAINPNTWEHLLLERSALPELWENWTQKETRTIVEAIGKIVLERV